MIKSLQKISKISFKKDDDVSSSMFFYPGGTYLSLEFSKKDFGFGSIGLYQNKNSIFLSNEMMSRKTCANFLISHFASLPLTNGLKIEKRVNEAADIEKMLNYVWAERQKIMKGYLTKNPNKYKQEDIDGFVLPVSVLNKKFDKEKNTISGIIEIENQDYCKVEIDLNKMGEMKWFDFFRNKWEETDSKQIEDVCTSEEPYIIDENTAEIVFSMVFCVNWLGKTNKKTMDVVKNMEMVEVKGLLLKNCEISMNNKEMKNMQVSIVKNKDEENFHFEAILNNNKHEIFIDFHNTDEKKVISINCPTDVTVIPKAIAKIVNEMVLEDQDYMVHSYMVTKLSKIKEWEQLHKKIIACINNEKLKDVGKYLEIEKYVKEMKEMKDKFKIKDENFDDFMINYEKFYKERI